MKAEFRFLRTRDGASRFTGAIVSAERAEDWCVVADAPSAVSGASYRAESRRGLERAAVEGARRGVPPHRVRLEDLQEAAVDSAPDAVECATLVAAWKALGGREDEVVLAWEAGRWLARFADAS